MCEDSPVRVRRVLLRVPVRRIREFAVQPALGLALIVNAIDADNALKKDVQLRMRGRILCRFKEWCEDV